MTDNTYGAGSAPAVIISPTGGAVTVPIRIQLSCGASNAVIRYTLDGTVPSPQSPIYRNPLAVNQTVRLRARAYQDGLLPGPPRSESYYFLQANLKKFTSNLPVLVLDALGPELPNFPGYSSAHLSWFEPVRGRTSLTNPPSLTVRAAARFRGSSTLNMPKSSFALSFLDESNQELPHSVLGLPADSEWVLYGPNHFEPVMIHNPFIHQLSRDMGRYSPRTRFLEVFYLMRNSSSLSLRDYEGIYVLEEKIKIGQHRVDIDPLGPTDIKPPEVTGGYLLKIDRLGPGEGGFWAGDMSLVYVEPKESVLNLPQRSPQKQFLETYFTDFERALYGANWKDPKVGYRAYLDVESWIDYHVLEVLSGNVDALVFSTYFYKPRNGKLHFGPHWDFDRALGSTDGRDDEPREWNTGRFFSRPWWERLFRDPDFWQRWVDRWQELRQNQFSRAHLNGLIDRLAGELREAQPREEARWGVQPRGGTYQSEIDVMKDWLSNRVDFIDRQLVPKPGFIAPTGPVKLGEAVTLTVPTPATVYYTLDGSDPRLSQGSVASNTLTYLGPIRLNADVRLVARAHDPTKRQTGGPRTSTPWSGPVTATIKVIPP